MRAASKVRQNTHPGLICFQDLYVHWYESWVIPLKSRHCSVGKLALQESFSGPRVKSLSLLINPPWFSSTAQRGCTELTAV